MNHDSTTAKPHAGESRDHYDLARDVSGVRGEVRVLKWACGIAIVALLGGMGALYQHQQALGRNIQEVREDVGRIDERTIQLDKRLTVIEDLLRVLVARPPDNS